MCVCVCVCVERCVCVRVCVLVCVDVDVYERIRKFSECQTGSEQRAFIVQGEDAYRGRLPRTPPCFSGAFSPVRARMGPRPIKARPFEPNGCRRGGEEARGRSGPVEKSRLCVPHPARHWRNVTRNNGTAFRRVMASSRIQQIPSDYVSPVRVPSSTELRLPNVGSSTCGRSGILMLIFFRSRLPSISHGSSSPSIGRIGTKSCLSQMYIL